MTRLFGNSLRRARTAMLSLPLAFALFFASSDARATATFDGTAFATLTITGVTNLTTPEDLGGLFIEGGAFVDCGCGDPALILEGDATGSFSASVSPELTEPFFDYTVLGAGDSITMDLAGDGTATTNGYADLLLLASAAIFFTNDTGTQTYSVDLELDYELTTSASIGDPSTEDAFAFAELFAGPFFGPGEFDDFSEADTLFGSFTGPAGDTLSFNLIIGPDGFEAFGVDLALEGLAEAVIPAPAAVPMLIGGLVFAALRRNHKNA